jgi:drug/metabolite transporter (DMT)-like permease
MKRWAYGLIAVSAILWGLIGVFVQGLHDLGFTSLQIVALRFGSAAVIMVIILLIFDRSLLKIKTKDCLYFVGTGIFSLAFFNLCYFETMQESSLAVAAVLLYTAPTFVTIMSYIFFKETLTQNKVSSLIITFIGCVFVAGYFADTENTISTLGLLTGIGSGFGYALYSIFGKSALKKYHPMTIAAYTFIFASVAMIPISGFADSIELFQNGDVWYYTLTLGFIPTVLAYIFYTKGLSYVESSKASITATIEPVVAASVGVFMFGEILSLLQIAGIILVIVAVIMMQGKDK